MFCEFSTSERLTFDDQARYGYSPTSVHGVNFTLIHEIFAVHLHASAHKLEFLTGMFQLLFNWYLTGILQLVFSISQCFEYC